MRRTIGIMTAGILLATGALFVARRARRINDWPIVNAPPGPGPIICFGDSLVSGVGADSAEDSYPAQLAALLGQDVIVVGTPGHTAEEGLGKLMADPRIRGSIVVVTLGGNDILRRIPRQHTEEALARIFAELHSRGAMAVFTAVEGPLRGGRTRAYRDLCRRQGAVFVPDILGGIISDIGLRADPIHPNSAGYRIMAERVAAVLAPYLRDRPQPAAVGSSR